MVSQRAEIVMRPLRLCSPVPSRASDHGETLRGTELQLIDNLGRESGRAQDGRHYVLPSARGDSRMGNQRSNSERLICSGPKESVRGIAFCNELFNSTESLILAQDERWRRA